MQLSDTFPAMDESRTDRLITTDISALTGPELLAHLDEVEQQIRTIHKTKLALLEDNPHLVAQSPDLQALLKQLRTLNLDDVVVTPPAAQAPGADHPGS